MGHDLFFHALLLLGLLWLCVILYGCGHGVEPRRTRPMASSQAVHGGSQAPKPFPGLTEKALL